MSLQGKSIIVTGGASGMGRATALLVAKRGAKVAIADVNADGGAKTASEIEKAGGKAFFQTTDLSERKQVQALVKRTVDAYGRVDVLAHVAAIAVHKSFMDLDDELWHRTIRVCLDATFYVDQEVAKVMVPQGGGRIINFASQVAATGGPMLPAYSAAKAGVVALSKTIQKELARKKVMVFCVAPGATDTPLWRANKSQADMDKVRQVMPFGVATPEQIAELVAFLADDATGGILAGQTFHTNGSNFMGF